jgi:DNA-binding NarL/FixJ family response regulator
MRVPEAPRDVNEIKVLIADDHTIIFSGIKLILNLNLNIKNIVECSQLSSLLPTIEKENPTHIILDVTFPEGSSITLIEKIIERHPETRILLFSMHPEVMFQRILSKYKIDYCEKKTSEIEITRRFSEFFNGVSVPRLNKKPLIKGKRENQILHMLMEGKSTLSIATELGIKSNTVSTIKARIFHKLNVTNIVELVQLYK